MHPSPSDDSRCYLYTGCEFDAATGLQYNRNRWYDPHLGRFMTQDPIGFAGGNPKLNRAVSTYQIANQFDGDFA